MSAVALAGTAIVTIAIGFVLLPLLQPDGDTLSVWQRICHAAGLSSPPSSGQTPVASATATSQVVIVPRMLMAQATTAIGRGATLAQQCGSCHGARGVSGADIPNLAGQYPAVIYKELLDYASTARVNAVMSPRVRALTDTDMRDLAAFYAYLPRAGAGTTGPAPQIVASGSPMQNIAPCGACHGAPDYKTGSPWLAGEPAVYLQAQLVAFATGARHNDISEQMRNVARGMSAAQMKAAADYYGGRP